MASAGYTYYYSVAGIIMPGKGFDAKKYRYGFNGKENDNEVYGSTGTFQDYGMRMYDTRLGRFISVDPISKEYPYYSPYQFAGNKPVLFVDLDGLEEGKKAIGFNSAIDVVAAGTVKAASYFYMFRAVASMAAGDKKGYEKYMECGLLLSNFASGTGPNTQYFSSTSTISQELNRGNRLVNYAMTEFSSALEEMGKTPEEYFNENVAYRGTYNFSPDHTDTYWESAEKHTDAAKHPVDLVFGGMNISILPIRNMESDDNEIIGFSITFENIMSRESLMYRSGENISRDNNESQPLSTQRQIFNFTFYTKEESSTDGGNQ
ncbi:MAG: hypothetical protein KKD31_02410 [Bacteroidetes bacterium]|nr:hypothetical protein [Bacteroidota bacterium]